MTTQHAQTLIIGAGQAALQAALSLRQFGHEGAIAMVGEEPFPPYQRPPLSKAYLKGALARERLYLRPDDWYQDQNVDLITGVRAEAIDRNARQVRFDDRSSRSYGALIIATGARPRMPAIDGATLEGVFLLRGLADIDAIKAHMETPRRIVIIGGGYIGLEAAAAARQLGHAVTLVETAARVLQRVAGPPISQFFENAHRREGVEVHTGASVSEITGEAGAVSGVRLAGGEVIDADMVLIGVGIIPNAEIAAQAGFALAGGGILTDRDARTSDPAIFAVGDCAARPLVNDGALVRLESVHNAIEQGKLAAAAIAGKPRPREDCPWFWSDQYDLKLQIAGVSSGYDETVVRGAPDDRQFAVFYLKERRLIAVDAINAPAEFIVSKKLIMDKASPDPALLADATVPIKTIAERCSG
ncbi:MAG: FAD-dependent oxidoreductase [Pseudomonadota bacterium]